MTLYLFTKRIFDIVTASIALALLFPLFVLIGFAVKMDSPGKVFFLQKRVGHYGKVFSMFKFRTMYTGSDKKGLLTIGDEDHRITRSGKFLRRYKLDELPQLINVLAGNMSLVGPRPEVQQYVDLYNAEQKKVLQAKPGITDPVSLQYFNENELMSRYADPEEGYVKEVMPEKLRLNLEYLEHRSFYSDLRILLMTIARIFS
ncbi:MAG TPA: sugar transferase [Chitinophagales bacterium]|nr:sugar transferase [Chitinophagales bacterium]